MPANSFNPAFGLSAVLTTKLRRYYLRNSSFNPAFGLSAVLTLAAEFLKRPSLSFNPAFGLSAVLTGSVDPDAVGRPSFQSRVRA